MDDHGEASEGEVSVRSLLEIMDLGHLSEEFEAHGIGTAEFLNLSAAAIRMLLPQPKYPFVLVLKFLDNYTELLKKSGCVLHPSLIVSSEGPADLSRSQDSSVNNKVSQKSDKEIEDNGSPRHDANPHSRGKDGDSAEGDTERHSDRREADSSDEDSLPPTKKKKKNSSSFLSESECEENDNSEQENDNESSSDQESNSSKKPLVNRKALGAKVKQNRSADTLVKELDVKALLKTSPLGRGVLSSYKKENHLSNDDRSTISDIIVPWLLKTTNYAPTHQHYMTLANKMVNVFPKENRKQWFVAPKEEGPQQKCKKGKLPMRVKNTKRTLVKKGALQGRAKNCKDSNTEHITISESDQEASSKEWLKRNYEPFDQVKFHWGRCISPRVKELILAKLSPASYVAKWSDLLKLPDGYQLVLQDFERLHEILPEKFGALEGKSENLMLNWNNFSSKVIEVMRSDLLRKQRAEYESLLAAAANENSRDFLILQILPDICKLNSWVKLGKARIKPSSVESRNAFILHVTDAAELQERIRERQTRFEALKAPIQPYITVVSNEETVTAAYVVVDNIFWKVSSVLKALEVCWKTCFCLNCAYSPEAQHIWLLIQKTIFKVNLPEDTNISSVLALLGRLE